MLGHGCRLRQTRILLQYVMRYALYTKFLALTGIIDLTLFACLEAEIRFLHLTRRLLMAKYRCSSSSTHGEMAKSAGDVDHLCTCNEQYRLLIPKKATPSICATVWRRLLLGKSTVLALFDLQSLQV